jgi:hypothetical protein
LRGTEKGDANLFYDADELMTEILRISTGDRIDRELTRRRVGGADGMDPQIETQIRKIGERIKKKYGAEKVILFGSYARGVMTRDSESISSLSRLRRRVSFSAWPR